MELPHLDAAQMTLVDRLAVEHGLSITQMMEVAGLNIARYAQKWNAKRILVLAGKGHNGGDALAAARHLFTWGYTVEVLLAEPPEQLKEASARHFQLLKEMGVFMKVWDGSKAHQQKFESVDLILDGLLGYPIQGDPRPPYDALIQNANDSRIPILAIDLPSGLDGTTGQPHTPTIRAQATLTLDLPKTGLFMETAHAYVGKLAVCELGIPHFIHEKAGINVPPELFAEHSIVELSP